MATVKLIWVLEEEEQQESNLDKGRRVLDREQETWLPPQPHCLSGM